MGLAVWMLARQLRAAIFRFLLVHASTLALIR